MIPTTAALAPIISGVGSAGAGVVVEVVVVELVVAVVVELVVEVVHVE